jgi:hypothetical protein
MLKKFVALSLIYAILLVSCFSTRAFAQTKTDAVTADTVKTETVVPKTDVKKVFSKDLQIGKSDTAVSESEIDFNKLEKMERKGAAKAKMSKKDKALIVLVIAGFIALGIVLAVFVKVKKCSEVSCNPDLDETCICDR